ncbi:AfaD family invasin [Aeromonas salmonicida]
MKMRLWRYIIALLLCVYVDVVLASVDVPNTELQLSFIPLEGGRLRDGDLIGRGQVLCGNTHNKFRVWLDSTYLAPDRQSYHLYLNDSRQAKIQVRLQGSGWLQALTEENGIIKIDNESRATFDIVVHGEQTVMPGVYPIHVKAACS